MSKYEERAFPMGKTKPSLAGLKNQLAHLKEDLGRFQALKPNGPMIAPLRGRIRELEAEIAAADEAKMREKQANAAAGDAADAQRDGPGLRPTTGQFPPRRR
jgi:capsule polysaccharide export protein KpsE/RkpR